MISAKYKVVLLDIEGTTSAIDFVHTTMFDYARNNLEDFLVSSFETKETIEALEVFAQDEKQPSLAAFLVGASSKAEKIDRIVNLASQRMKEDSKATGLKALQGMVWRKGFNNGELKGHIYNDVPDAFNRWKKSGITIAIYSSGSILAQKIYFANTIFGNLGTLISNHFDTTSGPKRISSSYENITNILNAKAGDILFLSDVTEELDAAKTAGMGTGLLIRPGNKPAGNNEHIAYHDFNT
ncbi:MAG: acireductone synthase, partial [Gemmataceae bacterium]|nr:acireductone synthase [Gemmataceae bacterium]